MISWRLLLGDDCNTVSGKFAQNGSQYIEYIDCRLMSLHTPWTIQDARPTIVAILLTLI